MGLFPFPEQMTLSTESSEHTFCINSKFAFYEYFTRVP